MRSQRVVFVLGKAQCSELAQQRLRQFADWQHRQAGIDLPLQVIEPGKAVRRLDAAVVLGGNP
ncbi:hypothetical protein D3C76_1346900 [compost metagenome]